MDQDDDLTAEALRAYLADRPVRSYAAVVSTGAAARGWADGRAPGGAVVVAGHQLSPRGHAGRPLEHPPGQGLGFSLILRPELPVAREGWLYTFVLCALVDALGEGAAIAWPDEVRRHGEMAVAVGIDTRAAEPGDDIEWAIANVLVPRAVVPRGELLASVLQAVEARGPSDAEVVLQAYEGACETMGQRVRLRSRAGTAATAEGRAVRALANGAIVLEMGDGREVPVRPQDVRSCERL
jgi:BirA family biotin operon repressor/biotin-[acetyl-CoA-carboxylase] ligase